MTFRETDFVGLIKTIKQKSATLKDAELFRKVIQVLIGIYEEIPIYPGLVDMCINNSMKEVPVGELKEGSFVSVKSDAGYVSGIYAGQKDGKIVLQDAKETVNKGDMEISAEKATYINENVLSDLWPTLKFKAEE